MATRYGDDELQEFKELIEKKIAAAIEQHQLIVEQIEETTENTNDDHGGDWVDDSSYNTNIEMLNNMANRQKKYIQDLQAALMRIRTKTYGVCVNTGELIDKKRLLAVPTTTKSLLAKSEEQLKKPDKGRNMPKRPYIKNKKKVLSSVIKRTSTNKSTKSLLDEDDDFLDEDLTDVDTNLNIDDVDIVDEDSDFSDD